MHWTQEHVGTMRDNFWTILTDLLNHEGNVGEVFGVTISGVGSVLHTRSMLEELYGFQLRDTPQMLFRDYLLALRQLQPTFTMRDLGRAFGRSRGHMSNLISAEPSSRARCTVHPHQYETLLAVLTRPSDFVAPSGPYGKWSR